MKNDAPNARSLESDNPFTIAAIECSRIPKCKIFPVGVSGSTAPGQLSLQETTEYFAPERSTLCRRRPVPRCPSRRREKRASCCPIQREAGAALSDRSRRPAQDSPFGSFQTASTIPGGPRRHELQSLARSSHRRRRELGIWHPPAIRSCV